MANRNNNPKNNKNEREIKSGFTFEEIITSEEAAILRGTSNNMTFDKRSVNAQLDLARRLK